MRRLGPPRDLNRALVLRFFWLFSSFERALKSSGFLKEDRYGNAQPDWERFVSEIAPLLASGASESFVGACSHLAARPPKRQIVEARRLAWREQEIRQNESKESFALRMVRTVRNNLFHGGKSPEGHVNEVERDEILLQASIAVLERCVNLHDATRAAFAHAA